MQSADPKTTLINTPCKPQFISCSEHGLSHSQISKHALKVLHKLSEAGYAAYLVGGCVRDILLGIEPKDFDVATDAYPEQIRTVFKNCRLIGRRFRLAHVYFGREIIEVSTFRASHHDASDKDGLAENGRIVRDNVYGKFDDDVWRRDFTVNALYYNIKDFSIVDHIGGIKDIQNQQLRVIGVAENRYREDPVRMLRAIRFAVKLNFSIDSDSVQAIFNLAPLLGDIPPARLFEEFLKLFMYGQAVKSYQQLREYGLFRMLFPQIEALLNQGDPFVHKLLLAALRNTDQRLAENKSVTPAFLLAAMLWMPVRQTAKQYQDDDTLSEIKAMQMAGDAVLSRQIASISIPRRFSHMMRDMWSLQVHLQFTEGKRPLKLLTHRRFRAAYDLLLLRAQENAELQTLADWWTTFEQQHMDIQLAAKIEHQKKRPRFRGRNRQ